VDERPTRMMDEQLDQGWCGSWTSSRHGAS